MLLVLGVLAYVLRPMLATDWHLLGVHDWEHTASQRYVVRKTILAFHQFPFWNPYACGGHTIWGGIESDTIVVSPMLPVFLLAPFATAVRIEVVALTLWGLAGAWLLASRFTRSHAICALVAIVWCLNGRFALQMTVGHSWHLEYSWMPWVFFFFDRAVDEARPVPSRRARDVVLGGVCLAMMAYMGGIYPLPQTAVALTIYAVVLAGTTRSHRPLLVLTAVACLGLALASPKLLPVLDELGRYPRRCASPETLDLGGFMRILVDPDHQDDPWWHPGGGLEGEWHEWGMYLGPTVFGTLVAGSLLARGERERAMLWAGGAMALFGFGSFHPYAPWSLLHLTPIFWSQHVPSRWLFPALLPFACATASSGERLLAGFSWRARPRLLAELAMVALVGWLAYGMERVARKPLAKTFAVEPPKMSDTTGPFVMERHQPPEIAYEKSEWLPPALPAEMGNFGTIDCITSHGRVTPGTRVDNRRAPGLGARGKGDPEYRGEAFVAEGVGAAEIVSWTPNVVEVHVRGAPPGAHLVLNQNWDPGWLADGRPVLDWADAVAAPLTASEQTVRFRYRPRTLWVGLLVAALAGAISIAAVRGPRRRRGRS